jgi:threonylcarbamoyladenosine tRNA methylthiotransferase MtaB
VPFARGNPVSRPADDIIKEIKEKEMQGFKEIVITGININKYQMSFPRRRESTLTDLLDLILQKTKIPRIRLSSIEPMQITNKFLKIFKNKRFCKHIHASLQSGSDKILKLMNRKYTSAEYIKMCKILKKNFPDIALTTDVIVGFPNETEEDFQKTLDLCQKAGFSKIHVFKYSKRKGTKAAEMSNQIPEDIKEKRCKILRNLSGEMEKMFIKSMTGKKKEVLFEKQKTKGLNEGFTDNYIKIRIKSDVILTNQILKVPIYIPKD